MKTLFKALKRLFITFTLFKANQSAFKLIYSYYVDLIAYWKEGLDNKEKSPPGNKKKQASQEDLAQWSNYFINLSTEFNGSDSLSGRIGSSLESSTLRGKKRYFFMSIFYFSLFVFCLFLMIFEVLSDSISFSATFYETVISLFFFASFLRSQFFLWVFSNSAIPPFSFWISRIYLRSSKSWLEGNCS